MRNLWSLVVLMAVLAAAACGPTPTPEPAGTLTLMLTAGPACPVVRDPPDPACAPRPVVGHDVVLLDGDREVARGTSDANGRIHFSVPYGRYTVHALGEGRFPTPPADQTVDVGEVPVELSLDYDTGIR